MEEKANRPLLDPGRSITRRDLLIGAGALAGGLSLAGFLAACGTSTTGTTNTGSTPQRGGGSKGFIDGQNINAAPDTARMIATFETLLIYDENYKLISDGLAETVTQDSPTQW